MHFLFYMTGLHSFVHYGTLSLRGHAHSKWAKSKTPSYCCLNKDILCTYEKKKKPCQKPDEVQWGVSEDFQL